MKLNKRAQFFLIAALVISGAILTLGRSYTKVTIQEEGAQLYDLSEQFKFEASQILDNGLVQGRAQQEITEDLKNLTLYYVKLNPDSAIDIIYGNETSLNSISANQSGEIIIINSLPSTGLSTTTTSTGLELTSTGQEESSSKKIKIKVPVESNKGSKKVDQTFELEKGENFYLVLRKKIKDQDVVIYR